jgi:hypothetical protein
MKPNRVHTGIKKRTALWASALALGGLWLMGAEFPKTPAISPGNELSARAYYERISTELSFPATPTTTTLDQLVAFAGYAISAADLESADPAILMDPVQATDRKMRGLDGTPLRDGDILASRFFAPKIVNVDAKAPIPGWRKLVRLIVRPGSSAAQSKVESVIILFNFFSPANESPFSGHSFNTQVMLIAPTLADRLYWLDFDDQGKLTLAVRASFDAGVLACRYCRTDSVW